jgi:hypothetical protein
VRGLNRVMRRMSAVRWMSRVRGMRRKVHWLN